MPPDKIASVAYVLGIVAIMFLAASIFLWIAAFVLAIVERK